MEAVLRVRGALLALTLVPAALFSVSVENPAWAGTFVMGTTEVPANVTINGPVRGTEVSAVFLRAISGT